MTDPIFGKYSFMNLAGVLEAKKASIEEYKKEETEVAEEVAALRKHTKSLMATIKSEKAVSLSNL